MMKRLLFVVVVLVMVAGGSALFAGHDHQLLDAAALEWSDVASLPAGAKVAVLEGPISREGPVTFRLKLPANYVIPPHWHPAIEHVTVISGTFHMGMGETFDRVATHPLSAGGFALMQPGVRHYGWTKEETIVQVHGIGPWQINYVNPSDDPRKK